MKKFLVLFAVLMLFASTPMAEAKKPTPDDIAPVGFKILESNNIQKRMVFKYTFSIKNPRATLDYKPENIGLDYTGRVLWVYGDVLNLTDNEDELAGLLSHAIAMGENSYKGLFRGFFSHAAYSFNSRPKENKADLKAVDYMVNAGYNPLALITIYSKTLAQTRYEWCHYYPLATNRMMNIYKYIYKNYPESVYTRHNEIKEQKQVAIRKNKKTNKWEFDYKDLRGKRQIKKGFKTKAEAERAYNKMVEDLNKGLNPVNAKMSLKEAGELYLRLHASSNCKPSTYKTYCGYLQNLVVPFFGKLNINEISPILVKEFIKQMQDKGRQNSTINKYVKFISAIYNFMIDSDAATRNPIARIKSLKEVKNDKIRALSTEEVQALLAKTKVVYPDFYPLLFTALFTGMRRGELLALTWDSINWVTGKITIDKNYVNGRLGTPKSSKTRYVDMSNELARVLKEWKLACPHSEINLVFPNTEGKYQSADNMIKRRFIPSLKRTGIDLIRFHDLRHTYASLLLANGAPMKYVQTQLGHASITMTMDLYTHLLPEVNDKCVNILNKIVSQSVKLTENIKIFGT